ncbi:indolepyruvate oxidoreductase subunit beta [bacterium]|nr:indolepyruvate oxidoreductase subunit beta [candidate division CSSED10-310 bacterium]
MKLDIILAGVGGQGILSIAFVIDNAAMKKGLRFKQAEVHGMSQRGGAVQSHLRISDEIIHSDLIPLGKADLVLGVEPMEALRYVHYLKPDGWLVTSSTPFVNIPNYPEHEKILEQIELLPNHVTIDSAALAKHAGNRRAENMVMVGAAMPLMPFSSEDVEEFIVHLFKSKGDKIVAVNLAAFNAGRSASEFYRRCLETGMTPAQTRLLSSRLDLTSIEAGVETAWAELFTGMGGALRVALEEMKELIPGNRETVDVITKAVKEGVEELKQIFGH